jgi:putative tricarboxylic transport membrane protein
MTSAYRPGLWRRRLAAAMLALGTLGLAPPAHALDQLKLIAPAAPGGGWDLTARSMQRALQASGILKKVQVANLPGAGGTIGLAKFVDTEKGRGDALLVSGLVMVGAILANNSPVSLADTTPIARLTGEYEIVVVPARSKFENLDDLIGTMKTSPGAVTWGGGSAGGTDHILVGLVAQAAGVDPTKIKYVPFARASQALAALLDGHVSVGVGGIGELIGEVQAGRLRALGVSAPDAMAGVKTLKEQGVEVELANWRGVVAPPGISAQQKQDLVAAVGQMVESKIWQATLQQNDWSDLYLVGDQFDRFLEAEQARVRKVLTDIGLVK